MSRTDMIPKVVISACVLHSIIIEREGNNNVVQEEAGDEDRGNEHIGNASNTTAALKQDKIAERL